MRTAPPQRGPSARRAHVAEQRLAAAGPLLLAHAQPLGEVVLLERLRLRPAAHADDARLLQSKTRIRDEAHVVLGFQLDAKLIAEALVRVVGAEPLIGVYAAAGVEPPKVFNILMVSADEYARASPASMPPAPAEPGPSRAEPQVCVCDLTRCLCSPPTLPP